MYPEPHPSQEHVHGITVEKYCEGNLNKHSVAKWVLDWMSKAYSSTAKPKFPPDLLKPSN